MLRFVVALECEARPLLERYRLDQDPVHRAFKVFRREDVALVVSGVGKSAAAAATAYLHLAAGGGRDAAWINAGIAGHRDRATGEAFVAHKVRDLAADRCWYPPRVVETSCPACEVITVDRPETVFPEPAAYEMEAAGFYATATRFATGELVQCFKVVSDGPATWSAGAPAADFSKERITGLVAGQLDAVVQLADGCRALAEEVRGPAADPADLARCLERWRFTVTQERQLRRLLRRRQTLARDRPLPLDGLGPGARGGDVNRRLQEWLDALPVTLGASSPEFGSAA